MLHWSDFNWYAMSLSIFCLANTLGTVHSMLFDDTAAARNSDSPLLKLHSQPANHLTARPTLVRSNFTSEPTCYPQLHARPDFCRGTGSVLSDFISPLDIEYEPALNAIVLSSVPQLASRQDTSCHNVYLRSNRSH